MIKWLFFTIASVLFGCTLSKKSFSNELNSKETNKITHNNTLTTVEYFNGSNKLKSILFFDFDMNQSFYLEYGLNQRLICEGKFNINSYDTLKVYTDTLYMQDIGFPGSFNQEVEIFNAKKDGIWRYYYSNGVLQMEGNYLNNKRDGIWNFYNDFGNRNIIRYYNKGEVVKDSLVTNGIYVVPPR